MTGKELQRDAKRGGVRKLRVLERCVEYLKRGDYDKIIKPLLAAEFGVTLPLAQDMIDIARRCLIKQYFGEDKRAPVFNAIFVLDGFITDPDCPPAVRLAAQIEKDRIFGLHKPQVIEQKTSGEITHRVEVVYTKDWRQTCAIDLNALEKAPVDTG